MSHTIPYTRAEQDKTIANAVNHAFRHCRIGKVRMEPRPDYAKGLPSSLRYVPPKEPVFLWNHTHGGGFVPTGNSADVPIVPSHGVML